ncbi:hypothetical protein ACHAWF_015753, partial [Thalassiosira exigua]
EATDDGDDAAFGDRFQNRGIRHRRSAARGKRPREMAPTGPAGEEEGRPPPSAAPSSAPRRSGVPSEAGRAASSDAMEPRRRSEGASFDREEGPSSAACAPPPSPENPFASPPGDDGGSDEAKDRAREPTSLRTEVDPRGAEDLLPDGPAAVPPGSARGDEPATGGTHKARDGGDLPRKEEEDRAEAGSAPFPCGSAAFGGEPDGGAFAQHVDLSERCDPAASDDAAVPAKNPFDSPPEGEESRDAPPAKNPFASPPEADAEERNRGVVRRLEAIFASETERDEKDNVHTMDATIQRADLQEPPEQRGAAKDAHKADGTVQRDDSEEPSKSRGKEKNSAWDADETPEDDRRGTTRTQESRWTDNAIHGDPNDGSDDEEGSVWDRPCGRCFLRCVSRACRPKISPPCVRCARCTRDLLHPGLPPCLERIPPRTRRIACRALIITFMIVTITFTLLDLLITHRYLHAWLDDLLGWLSDHPVGGGVSFVGVFLVASLCFFPTPLLSLGAGFVYIELYGLGRGIAAAFAVCYLGCLLGAAVCFARSRYLMRALVVRFSAKYPVVRAVDRAFETSGMRLFLLLRLSPAMPFNALNYIGGITSIGFRNYWWATFYGIVPNLLWTIFVGATFGTVNERGVDGKKEFDRESVRRGVVLGLGIGLGVMGLVGTGIYARKELTKIVIAEQTQRALEEQAMSEHLMSSQCDAIAEEGDSDSLSFEDLENPDLDDCWNPQLEDSDSELPRRSDGRRSPNPSGASASSSSVRRSDSDATPDGRGRATRRPWTPEAVAAELPILPKVLRRYLSPIVSADSAMASNEFRSEYEGNVSEASSAANPIDGPVRKHLVLSASMPPMHWRNSLSLDLPENAEERSLVENESPPSLPRRHTIDHDSLDNVQAALMTPSPSKEDKPSRPRVGSASNLAHIDETKVLSDDEHSEGVDISQMSTIPPGDASKESYNRRRCNTDPTDIVKRGPESADDSEGSESVGSGIKGRPRSPFWTPTRKPATVRKTNSFGSFGAWQQASGRDRPESVRARSKSPYRSTSRGPLRRRASSLPFELSPSGHHMELTIGNDDLVDLVEEEDGPSREWFWIWA